MSEREALEILYDGWDHYQRQLADVTEHLTDEQLALRAGPELRSVGEQLQHIVAVRAGWLHGDLGEGAPEYMDIAAWADPSARQRSVDELRQGLEATSVLIRECLDRFSPEDLAETVHSRWPDQGDETFTRGWVIWHLIEHDLHHGGELGFLLGMHGLPAPAI